MSHIDRRIAGMELVAGWEYIARTSSQKQTDDIRFDPLSISDVVRAYEAKHSSSSVRE